MKVKELEYQMQLYPCRKISNFHGEWASLYYILKNDQYMLYVEQLSLNNIFLVIGEEEEIKKLYGYLISYLLGIIKEEKFREMYPDLRIKK